MRIITYTELSAHGPMPFKTNGRLQDLLLEIRWISNTGLLPPLKILNDLFSRGSYGGGMTGGVEWDTFQITDEEWQELLIDLSSDGALFKCEYVCPSDWVQGWDDWIIWYHEYKHGFPTEIREVARQITELDREMKLLILNKQNHDRYIDLQLQLVSLCDKRREILKKSNVAERFKR